MFHVLAHVAYLSASKKKEQQLQVKLKEMISLTTDQFEQQQKELEMLKRQGNAGEDVAGSDD